MLNKLLISSLAFCSLSALSVGSPAFPDAPALGGPATAYAAPVPGDSSLYLKLDGNTDNSSGGASAVTAIGTPSYAEGRIGQAFAFGKAGTYLNAGNSSAVSLGSATDYTVSFWIRSTGVTGDPVIIGNKNWNSGANAGWLLSLQSNGSVKWNFTPAGSSRSDTTIAGIADSQWHHIAVSHRRSGSAKFYKDGQLVTSVDISQKQGSLDTALPLQIGQDGTGKYSSVLSASLDELQLFKRELTADEIAALYQAAPSSAKKVLVIGIDGLRPDALQAANTPNIDALTADGAYDYKTQANSNYTWSATGWSTIHTGVWLNKHGVTDNNWTGQRFAQYPSLMKRAEQYKPSLYTASIVHWSPINTNLVEGIDLEKNVGTDAAVASETINLLKQTNPDLTFLQFDDVDHAGHSYGFGPSVKQYISAIETVDAQIGTIVSAIKSRSAYAQEDWIIMLTTDHGGKGTDHGGSSTEERTIFTIVSGKNALKGPITPSANQTDVMVTALKHLGVPLNTSWSLDGKPVGLKP